MKQVKARKQGFPREETGNLFLPSKMINNLPLMSQWKMLQKGHNVIAYSWLSNKW